MTLTGYQAFLFEVNEYLPKHQKLTDYQLARLFANEFPHSKPMQRLLLTYNRGEAEHKSDTVGYYRYRYNKGYILRNKPDKRKGPISFKYNSEGERISYRGTTGKLLTEKEYELTIKRFGPDERREADFNWRVQVHHPVRQKKGRQTYESFDWCI